MPDARPPEPPDARVGGPGPSDEELFALARSLSPADRRLDSPPPELWDRITEALAEPTPRAAARPAVAARRPRGWRLLAAAVVVVALGAAGALAVARGGDSARVEAEVALSNAGLDPAGAAGSGVAELTVRDGRYELVVRLSNVAAPGDAYLELWLIDRSVEGMVSLGPYHGDGGYPLPASVAPGAFPVVDVSIEPVDGAPTHSGRSVLRGVLEL